jgi:hypothetical protein
MNENLFPENHLRLSELHVRGRRRRIVPPQVTAHSPPTHLQVRIFFPFTMQLWQRCQYEKKRATMM